MMGEPNDMATVCFPDGSSAHVPYVVLRRSHILYDALTETSGVDNTVIHAPVALFHSWLECASLLETREENLADADSDTLLNYLLASDYFADEGAVVTVCGLLGQHLFAADPRGNVGYVHNAEAAVMMATTALQSTKQKVEQVISQLPDNLTVSLLRASMSSLDTQLQLLPPQAHLLAVHAAFPSFLQDGTLLLDCSVNTTAAATAALRAVSAMHCSNPDAGRCCNLWRDFWCESLLNQPNSVLSSLHVRSLALRGITSPAEKKFTCALFHAVCAGAKHVSITSAEISDLHFQKILSALAKNTSLESLEIGLFDNFRAREPPLAAVIAQGLAQITGLQSLTLRNMPERTDFHLPRTLQPLTLQTTLQSLTRLTELQLDSSIQCVEGVSSFLSHLVHLHTLELCVYVYKEYQAEDLAVALTHLTGLRNLTCAGEGYAVLPALESPRLAYLSKLDLDLSSGSADGHLRTLVAAIRHMHELQDLALRVPSIGSGDAAVALLDSLQHCRCFSRLMLRGVHVASPSAGISLCRKLAGLDNLRHLHLHTSAVFVPAQLSAAHMRAMMRQPGNTHAARMPSSPPQQNIDTWPLLWPPALARNFGHYGGYTATVVGLVEDAQVGEPLQTGHGGSVQQRSTSEGTRTSSAAGRVDVSVADLQKGPLPFLPHLTHLTLRESSDWSRLESTLRDFPEPLQPLTAFLLRGLSSLRQLQFLEIDDDLQDGSPQQLASSLAAAFSHMPQLAAVRLLSCNMSAPAARLIAAPLAGAALTSLSLNRAFWDQQAVKEVAPALQKLMHLQDLTIVGDAYFQMSADCAAVVAASLRCLTALLRFTMTCCRKVACRFAEGGLEALAPGLHPLTGLRHLDLSFNSILDAGMEPLAASLRNLTSLQSLSLSDNDLTSAGAQMLAAAVSDLPSLQHLDLSHNPINNKGANSLAQLLSVRSSLRTLDVACSRMSGAGESVLQEVLGEEDPMRCCHLLDENWVVNLCGFEADDDCVQLQ